MSKRSVQSPRIAGHAQEPLKRKVDATMAGKARTGRHKTATTPRAERRNIIPLPCFVLRASDGTLQQRIRQMIAEGIIAGRFRPGERLPSTRALARHLGVSRITVSLAYAELVAEDFLVAEGRSGHRVSATAPRPVLPVMPSGATKSETVLWGRFLSPLAHRQPIDLGKPPDWRSYRFPFVYGQADPTLFDHANWRLCVLQALGQRDFARMADDQFERDDPDLVEFAARHTLPRRGIIAREEEVLFTLGAQNALWLTVELLLGPGKQAAMEEPGYPPLRDLLRQSGARVHLLPVGRFGLAPDQVPKGIDVLFCTPSHQCPTGVTMPLAARKALLARAERDDFIIVEDDYDFENAHGQTPLPALKALDPCGRVIHVGSFSKSLFPGLRLGFLVGPAPFISAARRLRGAVLRHPPGLLQRAAAHFMALGHYDALLRRLAEAYSRRKQVMREALLAHGLDIAGPREGGGSSFWMRTRKGVAATALAEALRNDSVLIEPGRPFFGAPDTPDHYYRIAYSSISEDRIAQGIGKIAACLRLLGG